MAIHLIKLAVGPESVADLENWQALRLREKKRNHEKPELIHITRRMPRRAEELLDGGSLYWVIKGWVCARQKVLELREIRQDGIPYCAIVLDKEIIRVQPRPRRPFQGWRYFDLKDVPPDIVKSKGKAGKNISDKMSRELAMLGLL